MSDSNLDAMDMELPGESEPDQDSDDEELHIAPVISDRLLAYASMQNDGREVPESTAELPKDKGKGKETEEDVLRREIREEVYGALKAHFNSELASERTGWENEKARWVSEKRWIKEQTDHAAHLADGVIESLKDQVKKMEQASNAMFSKGQQAAISNCSGQWSSMQEQLQTGQRTLDEEARRVAGHTQKIAEQEEEISRLRQEGGGQVADLRQQLAAKDEHAKRLEDQLAAEQRSHDEAMRKFQEQRSQPGTSTEPANAPDPQPLESLTHPDQQRLEAQVGSLRAALARMTDDAVELKQQAQWKLEDTSLDAKRKIRTLEAEKKVMTEAKSELHQDINSLEADLNQGKEVNQALSEEVSALKAKLKRARGRVEKVEGQVRELTEAKEASEAEVLSLVAANRALEAEKKKAPASGSWESYPLFEGLSLRNRANEQKRKLEELGHRLEEYEAREKEANRRLAEYEAREREAGELEDLADGGEEAVASSSSESAAVVEEADASPSSESAAVAEEAETGEKEMDSLLGGLMGAIEGLLGPQFPDWKEFLLWLLVILLLIGIVAAFAEASAAAMAKEMWLERGFRDVPRGVLEDPWLDLSRGMYRV